MAEKPGVVVNKLGKTPPIMQDLFPTPEIFASEIGSIAVLHGNIVVTLGNPRVNQQADGQPGKPLHVVAGRVILTSAAAQQLLAGVKGLADKLRAVVDEKKTEKP